MALSCLQNPGRSKSTPSTIYNVDSNKVYQTDSLGRVERVEADLSKIKNDRNSYQQCAAGKCGLAGDDGGHLIATLLNGPGERLNIVPMNSNLNRGRWRTMEKGWADALDAGKSVKVKIEPVYFDSGVRPGAFRVTYSVDGGRPVILNFNNSPGGI